MTDTKANLEAVRRVFEEGINNNDPTVFAEVIAANYVNHDMPAPEPGPDGFREVVGQFLTAFPDMKVTLDDVVADGDKVWTRGRFTGTHNAPFMGVPASGRSVEIKYLDEWRLEGGKAVENWVQMDLLGLMQQIGAIPAP